MLRDPDTALAPAAGEHMSGRDSSGTVRVVVVDDNADESRSLEKRLQGDGIEIVLLQPTVSLEPLMDLVGKAISGNAPTIVLLDYRLDDQVLSSGERAKYRGGTVAGFLRDKHPGIPIVLLTSDEKLHKSVMTHPGVEEVFDWILLKETLAAPSTAELSRVRVCELARLWHQVRGWSEFDDGFWPALAALLRVDEAKLTPFRQLDTKVANIESPGEAARWLLDGPLRHNGPLLDDDQARVTLGVDEQSFARQELINWIEPATYVGPLQSFGRRWWADDLRSILADAAGGTRPVEATARAAVVSRATGIDVTPELCQWCSSERTLRACVECGRATDALHALRALSEPPPAWAEPHTVCFSCIEEGRGDSYRFAPDAEEVFEGITTGAVKRPVEQ
jgi:CheY-like chemotaxis protein